MTGILCSVVTNLPFTFALIGTRRLFDQKRALHREVRLVNHNVNKRLWIFMLCVKLILCAHFAWIQGAQLKKHIDATLGSGNLREAVRLPPGEDLNEWLAINGNEFTGFNM